MRRRRRITVKSLRGRALCLLLLVGFLAGLAGCDSTLPTAPSQQTTAGWTVTSIYPECITDTQNYLNYLETGQPPSLDLRYGSDREHVQYLTGDTRRIELTRLATEHVQQCERDTSNQRAAERQAAIAPKEKAFCDQVGGQWMFGTDCDVNYGGPGHMYTVKFDGQTGDVIGERDGCPGSEWHADTHICDAP